MMLNPFRFGLGGGAATDPYYSSVVALLHGNGTNSSTTFTDNAPNPKIYVANGDAQISTAQSKFGGASMLFDGASDLLTAATSTDFDLGNTYTVEYWIRPVSISNNFGIVHRGNYNNSNNTWETLAFSHRWLDTYLRIYFYATNTFDEQYIDVTNAFSENTWTFVQVNRSGTTGEVFINGASAGTIANLNTPPATAETLRIARWTLPTGNEDFHGYLDDLRITKGVARPNAVPTEQFPDS